MRKYALLVVDLIKDNVNPCGNNPLDKEVVRILPTIRDMTRHFRGNGGRVVFACDSFIAGDFIFFVS